MLVCLQVSLILKDYGPGVRRIRYSRQGRDNQFWAGNYGTKFAFPSLALHLRRAGKSKSSVSSGADCLEELGRQPPVSLKRKN
jgi:F-box associated region